MPDPFIGPTCDGSCAIDGGEALCLRRLEPEGVQQVRVSGRRDRHEAEARQEADVADDALAPLELVLGELLLDLPTGVLKARDILLVLTSAQVCCSEAA